MKYIYLPFNFEPILYNIPTIGDILTTITICLGLYAISKFAWMIVYQIKYGGNAGDDYFAYGKEYVKRKYNNR
jgi:hypothetical protein